MTEPSTMYAILLTGHGDTDRLEWRDDVPVPTASTGDVVVKVAAAAVNNTDINTRIGWYAKTDADNPADDSMEGWAGDAMGFPRIQGADVCGRIVSVGAGVDPSRIDERVIVEPVFTEMHGRALDNTWYLGSECDGGFAEYTCVPGIHAHAIDTSLTDVELASFPCSYSTAENMLTRAAVEAHDTVLVTGASGGVGSAAVQLAAARGARVIAATSPSKADAVRSLGATTTVDRDVDLVEALGANSVDVVVDLVAGPTWPSLLDVLRSGGRYAVSGAIAGPMVELDVRTLYLKDLSFFGCTVLDPGVFAQLVRRIEAGHVEPLVAATFPLREIVEAQAAFQLKNHVGKIVLTVSTADSATPDAATPDAAGR